MVTSITADHQGKEKRSSLLESTGKIRARDGTSWPPPLPILEHHQASACACSHGCCRFTRWMPVVCFTASGSYNLHISIGGTRLIKHSGLFCSKEEGLMPGHLKAGVDAVLWTQPSWVPQVLSIVQALILSWVSQWVEPILKKGSMYSASSTNRTYPYTYYKSFLFRSLAWALFIGQQTSFLL